MDCWHCKHELIWGGDHDLEMEEEYSIVTNLSCPQCGSYVEVYYPTEEWSRSGQNLPDEEEDTDHVAILGQS